MGCNTRWEEAGAEAAWCCMWKKVLNAFDKCPWVTKSLRDAMRTPTMDDDGGGGASPDTIGL